MALMEQCSSLMDQLRQANGVAPEMPAVASPAAPPPQSARAHASPAGPAGGLMSLMQGARNSLRSSIASGVGGATDDERQSRRS